MLNVILKREKTIGIFLLPLSVCLSGQERTTMELTGDSMELKPINTRKLRRRGNEPTDTRSYPGTEKTDLKNLAKSACFVEKV